MAGADLFLETELTNTDVPVLNQNYTRQFFKKDRRRFFLQNCVTNTSSQPCAPRRVIAAPSSSALPPFCVSCVVWGV